MYGKLFCPILCLAQCIDAGEDSCFVLFYQILHLLLSSFCLLAHKASKKCFQFSRLATKAVTSFRNSHPASFLSLFQMHPSNLTQVSWIKMEKHSLQIKKWLSKSFVHVLIDSTFGTCGVNFCEFLAYSKKKLFSSYSAPVRTAKMPSLSKYLLVQPLYLSLKCPLPKLWRKEVLCWLPF